MHEPACWTLHFRLVCFLVETKCCHTRIALLCGERNIVQRCKGYAVSSNRKVVSNVWLRKRNHFDVVFVDFLHAGASRVGWRTRKQRRRRQAP